MCACSTLRADESVRRAKQQHWLFAPTPVDQRREFVTDRPDKTINPSTVDAGAVQVEVDIVSATFDRRTEKPSGPGPVVGGSGGFVRAQPRTGGAKDDYMFMLMNLRLGVAANLDLHFVVRPGQVLIKRDRGVQVSRGMGDSRLLAKYNLWGNDGGPTAGAVTAFVDVPTGVGLLSTGVTEGGTSFGWLWRGPKKTWLGLEAGLELRSDGSGEKLHIELPSSVSLSRGFTKRLSAKVELASVWSFEAPARLFLVAAMAALIMIGPDTQLDVGINLGATVAAPDYNPFLGISHRF